MHLKTCHEILVPELIGDSCSRQRVGSVHYWFKLPVQYYLELFIGKERQICTQQNKRYIPWLCHNLTDWVFYTATQLHKNFDNYHTFGMFCVSVSIASFTNGK